MIELIVVLWATVFDALRDRYYPTLQVDFPRWSREQWRWHIFKWLAFYPPLVYVIWSFQRYEKIFLALICFFLWRAVYSLGRPASQFTFYSRSRSTDVAPLPEDPEKEW